MTKQAQYLITCENCRIPLECPKCKRGQTHGSQFSKWLRKQNGFLSSQNFVGHNLDYIWFNYKQNWFITLEEKTNGGECTNSQKQVHNLLAQMLQFASGQAFDVSFGNKKEIAKVEYKGHYVIQFEKTNPDDSQWIKINGRKYNDKTCVKVLLMIGFLPGER